MGAAPLSVLEGCGRSPCFSSPSSFPVFRRPASNSGSQLLAKIEGATTSYYHADHLSVRVTTDTTGTVVGTQGHFPFGEDWYSTGTATKWKFTSYERDGGSGESGNDYAMMRSYVNRLARFSSPDPLAGSIADPQSLNRYAYTRNDPGNLIDPLGLDIVCLETIDGIPVACYDSIRVTATPLDVLFGGGGGGPHVPGLDLGTDEGGGGGGGQAPSRSVPERLKSILKNYPLCAGLLGGLEKAIRLVDNLTVNPTASGVPLIADAGHRATATGVASFHAPAAVWFDTRSAFGIWNQGPFPVYTNSTFYGYSTSQQMTILIHELHHVALGRTPQSQAIDVPDSGADSRAISELCGTALPPPFNR